MKILVLFAHPALSKSNVNKVMIEGMEQLDYVTFHDLYEHYPEFDIDVDYEQQLMEAHDVIVFQFPLFWYSTPAILKEWQDLVLEHGWAFGSEGNALKDKIFLCSVTVGGPREIYQEDGFHHHTLNQLLSPLRQTATLCKMKVLPPFAVHGAHGISKEEVITHREQLFGLFDELKNRTFKLDNACQHEYLNDYITKTN